MIWGLCKLLVKIKKMLSFCKKKVSFCLQFSIKVVPLHAKS